jgi:hypothetical protein
MGFVSYRQIPAPFGPQTSAYVVIVDAVVYGFVLIGTKYKGGIHVSHSEAC